MLHPLIRLAADRPQLIADHLLAYGELAGDELGLALAQWQRRLAWQLAVAVLALAALVLGGVALLLGLQPDGSAPAATALWLVPGAPAVLALLCALAARPGPGVRPFVELRAQLAADAQWLREALER
ncbi:MAG: hypothetical protein KF788_14360 [Piscinibacter sp.]|nr:hypothetical protein [Piscinibacter sp.]